MRAESTHHDDFYDRTATWLASVSISDMDRQRAAIVDLISGGPHRVLELGAGFGGTAAATADLGHNVVGLERSPRRVSLARRHMLLERPGCLRLLEADFRSIQLQESFDVIRR